MAATIQSWSVNGSTLTWRTGGLAPRGRPVPSTTAPVTTNHTATIQSWQDYENIFRFTAADGRRFDAVVNSYIAGPNSRKATKEEIVARLPAK